MDLTEMNFRQYLPTVLLLVSLVGLFLLGASYFVELRIIVEEPRYGDVTKLARTLWRALLGTTTIGSFLIGVYTLVRDGDDSEGLPTKVEIKGTGHDIDVYPSGPISDRDDVENGKEAESESEEESPSVDSDDVESDATEENPAN